MSRKISLVILLASILTIIGIQGYLMPNDIFMPYSDHLRNTIWGFSLPLVFHIGLNRLRSGHYVIILVMLSLSEYFNTTDTIGFNITKILFLALGLAISYLSFRKIIDVE